MSERPVQVGDTVSITGGPFSGGRARVESIDTEKGRAHVQMLVLGEPAPFTVRLNQVKVIDSTRQH